MPDVTGMLRALPHAVTPEPAGPGIAAADVARGHRALSRRRHRRVAGAAGAVAVVAGVAVAIGQPAQPGKSTPAAAGGTTFPQTSALRLTAYTGTQPGGFKVATVPAGWQVVSSDAYSFVVAPPGAPAGGASVAPAAAASRGGCAALRLPRRRRFLSARRAATRDGSWSCSRGCLSCRRTRW